MQKYVDDAGLVAFPITSVGEARKSEYLCKAVLKRLGLKEIAGALCWILVEKFGMEERYCVAEPDSVRGRFVLSEILAGGNFGQFDKRRWFGDSAIRSLCSVFTTPFGE